MRIPSSVNEKVSEMVVEAQGESHKTHFISEECVHTCVCAYVYIYEHVCPYTYVYMGVHVWYVYHVYMFVSVCVWRGDYILFFLGDWI